MISPILANVYLHDVFDLWVHRWRQTTASGGVVVTRYADDTVVGFQHEHEARAFLDDLEERMRAFDLTLHPDKTRLIRFGRHAAKQREDRGEGKPETFDFLGFTHFCTRSRKWGSFVIGRKTIKKRLLRRLQEVKTELRKRMHDPVVKTGTWVKQMLQGHLAYFAVPGNDPSLWWYFNEVRWRWLKSLKRRSQKAFLNWDDFTKLTDRFFPSIRILAPRRSEWVAGPTAGRTASEPLPFVRSRPSFRPDLHATQADGRAAVKVGRFICRPKGLTLTAASTAADLSVSGLGSLHHPRGAHGLRRSLTLLPLYPLETSESQNTHADSAHSALTRHICSIV